MSGLSFLPLVNLSWSVQTEQRVRDNADWLFKCIAEAHTTLTDPTERQELDSGLARQERHQRARAGSYRASPTSR